MNAQGTLQAILDSDEKFEAREINESISNEE